MGFILKRLINSIFLSVGIATIVFFLIRLLPDVSFSDIYLNPRLSEDVIQRIKASYGLDKPILIQFLNWLKEIITGNFGFSFIYRKPVIDCIIDSLAPTLIIGIPAFIFSFGVGILIGIHSAKNQGKLTERIAHSLLLILYSLPTFWLGIILILLFSYTLGLFPPSGLHSLNFNEMSLIEKIFDTILHIFLPAITLGTAPMAAIARFTRNTMLKVLSQTYIKTAKAKGLDERIIFYRHALPNALLPVVTLLGLYLPIFFAGSVVVEEIFSIPGIGKLTVDSIFQRDYPLTVGVTLFVSFIVIVGNLISDILYSILDPRIRLK
ncbi:MAG: ABC transporter permease [Candidatus Kryptonium sp.]|nr:ABC transporter permease [Candidatus Kryptonium sp.]